MKRYRVLTFDFDTRANVLGLMISEGWEPHIQEMWRQNQEALRQQLIVQFGVHDATSKLQNFIALGAAPFSVVAFHNDFYRQARSAFITGSYYPSLTGVCALGERVLNHLILTLREDFRGTPEYQRVHRKDSFDNWDLAITTLENWGVLRTQTVVLFRKLRDLRHRTLHFNPATERGTREIALDALRLFHEIVEEQFSAFGDRPWYIPNDTGISFVRRTAESDAFVARVILPSCTRVGPCHTLQHSEDGNWAALDPIDYPECEVSDDKFIELFKRAQNQVE